MTGANANSPSPPADDELLLQDLWEEVNQQGWDGSLLDGEAEVATDATAQVSKAGGNLSSPRNGNIILEDAPEGHDAHRKVKFYASQRKFAFKVPGLAGTLQKNFQVTAMAGKVTEEDAGRIARLCFMRFEEGAGRGDVDAYKQSLTQKCISGMRTSHGAPHTPSSQEKGMNSKSPLPPPTPTGTEVGNHKRKKMDEVPDLKSSSQEAPEASQAPKKPKDVAVPKDVVLPKDVAVPTDVAVDGRMEEQEPEDAPPGSEAFKRVRVKATTDNSGVCHFEYGGRYGIRLQTTQKAAGGSLEEAARICRLCYMKAEAGENKDACMEYRNLLYLRCKQRGGPLQPTSAAPPVSPEEASPQEPADVQPTEGESRSMPPVTATITTTKRPGDMVPMTPAGNPPGFGGGMTTPNPGLRRLAAEENPSAGPPEPVTPSESFGLDADGNRMADMPPMPPLTPMDDGDERGWHGGWRSQAWYGSRQNRSWAGSPDVDHSWNGGSDGDSWGGREASYPPRVLEPPPMTPAHLFHPANDADPQPKSPPSTFQSTGEPPKRTEIQVEQAKSKLSKDLHCLVEQLSYSSCVPGTAVQILEEFIPRFGPGPAFTVLSTVFNAFAEDTSDKEQSEAMRQVLMYLCHEILDLSKLNPQNEAFEHVRCNFFDPIGDAVCKAPTDERMTYESLIRIWEQREFFESSVIEGLRSSWNLES